ncbi:MAG: cation:proton antiporter [Actinomycetota bacterium]
MQGFNLRTALYAGLLFGLLLTHAWRPAQAQEHSPAAAPHIAAAAEAPAAEHPEAGGHTELINQLLIGLVLILVGAKLGGALFERAGQPAVLGEILFGILLGNLGLIGLDGLEFLRHNQAITALSELGVVVLLFEVGLESNVQEMRRVGASSLLVAVLGVVAPFALGWGTARYFLPHEPWQVHTFVGAALCATSVGITARVLRDLGQLQRSESRIVLGAAVIDDVLGLVILAVVSGLIKASSGGAPLSALGIALIILQSLGFLVGAILIGGILSPRLFRAAGSLRIEHMLLVTSLSLCFGLAWLAAQIGLAPIVGAFAAGLILDPVHYKDQNLGEHTVEELVHPIAAFLIPVFFVVTGMSVDLAALGNVSVLGFAAVLTVVAIVGKQACYFGVLGPGLNRLAVGIGMVPRGEVGLIFANIGLTLHVIGPGGKLEPVVSSSTFSAVVIMVMVTTLVTPPLLKWALLRDVSRGEPA